MRSAGAPPPPSPPRRASPSLAPGFYLPASAPACPSPHFDPPAAPLPSLLLPSPQEAELTALLAAREAQLSAALAEREADMAALQEAAEAEVTGARYGVRGAIQLYYHTAAVKRVFG